MADNMHTAGVEFDALTPEVWSPAFYPVLLESLPMNSSIATNYAGEIANLGDTVNIVSFPQFQVAETIMENQKVDADAVTATKTQLVVNKQVVKDFIISDRASVQSIDASNQLRDLAFHAILKRMHQIIVSLVAPSTSAPDHTIAFDSGTTLGLADILEVKELLDGADVPDDGSRVMGLGAAQWNDVFNISGLTSRDFVSADGVMSSGSLPGRVMGFIPKLSSEFGNTSYFFHPMFMQMAVQQALNVKVYDQGVSGYRSTRINCSILFGVKQISNLRVATLG
jgi:hypothetical protein